MLSTLRRSLHTPRARGTVQRWFGSSANQGKAFDKILIANRGEIACRVISSAKKLGIKTVAIYSEPDKHGVHVKMADEAVCVGPAESAQSYLNMPAIMDAIKQTGAQAVHPGYGFLSENSEFSGMLAKAGVQFIGPKEYAIESMGDKIASKQIARDANVNTIPGWLGQVENDEEVIKIAQEIGYPVMIKASAGGGGKGMRVAWDDAEAVEGFRLSRQEALASFGDDTIFLEKFIEDPRHIEIQVLCDRHGNGVWLNERECSIQRRNQKVIEEAPSVILTPELRKEMGDQAVALARAVQYESAGTVEFLLDKHNNFYFLEMNTRLQVEHPVTELITGVDLVEEMINVAAGRELAIKQENIGIKGWAIESRVYAEDPLREFLPSIGNLQEYQEPSGPGIRVDSGVTEGSEISIYYDPMISKLVTYADTRQEAIDGMKEALDKYVIRGVTSNVNFLRDLCEHPRFVEGALTTGFIAEEYPEGYFGHTLTDEEQTALTAGALLVHTRQLATQVSIDGQNESFDAHKSIADRMAELTVTLKGQKDVETDKITVESVDVMPELQSVTFTTPKGETVQAEGSVVAGEPVFEVTVNGKKHILQVVNAQDDSSTYTVLTCGTKYDVTLTTPLEDKLLEYMPVKEEIDHAKMLVSPMPGSVYSFNVEVGDTVQAGQEVCVVEAMKMQNVLRSGGTGVVKAVHVKQGDTVACDEILMELE